MISCYNRVWNIPTNENKLTAWSIALPVQLIVAQLVKTFPAVMAVED
jgi:hypothetical protein